MSSPASGARTLLGLKIDRQIPGQQLGCPEPIVFPIAAPTAPATSLGAAGNVRGAAVLYKMATLYAGRGETAASAASSPLEVVLHAYTIGAAAPVGTPFLDDATSSGTFSGSGAPVFDVVIDGVGAPDTFKWKKDSGGYTAGVPITGAAQDLSDGVKVMFGATTGHQGIATVVAAPVGTPALDDLTAGGENNYTGLAVQVFEIEIDGNGPPDTFRWRPQGAGSWSGETVAIIGGPMTTLPDWVTLTFGATTGHTIGDAWLVTATPLTPDHWTITVADVVSGAIVTVTPAVSPTTGGAVVLGRVFYRSIDGDPYGEIKRLWTNTTDPFDDNVAPGAEGTRTPRSGTTGVSAEQTAANVGFQFIRPDAGTDFSRDDTSDKSTEQTGQLGEPRAIPGMVKYDHPFNCDARIGTLVPLLASMRGKPSAAQNAGEPVVVYGFPSSDLPSDSISISGLFYKGGGLRPQLFLGMKCSEIDLSLGKKQAQLKAKLTGQHDTEAGFGRALVGNTGTFGSAPVVRGVRSDANATSYSVFVKIQTAPAEAGGLGSFTIRATLAAAGTSSPSFGTAITLPVYYDPTTKRQCHPAAIGNATATTHQSAWVELWESTTGLALGFDEGENRKPFEVYFPGDVSLLAAGDIFELPAAQKIPGVYTAANPTGPSDDGSYSGQRPRFTFTSRMTPAHVTITRGSGSSAQVILNAQAGALKITRPVDAVEGLGPEAANPIDVDVFGKLVLTLDIERRYIDREFERIAKSDARLYAVVRLQSHRIVVDPVAGTLSADREEATFTYAQARVEKTASPFSGDKVTPEKVTLIGEQPDDDDVVEAVAITAKTAHSWDFSRV